MVFWGCFASMVVLLVALVCGANGGENSRVLSFDVLKSTGMSSEAYHRRSANYWTAARRKAAKPIEELKKNRSNRTSRRQSVFVNLDDENGTPVVIPGELPDNSTIRSRLISPGNQLVRTAGKVYFSTYFGDAMCSGCVVTAPSGSLVITAAHCLYDVDYGYWYSNWIFMPAYDYGVDPYGTWSASYVAVPTAYTQAPDFGSAAYYDVGFAVMSPIFGRRISQYTGSQGIGFNLARFQLTYLFGYPADIGDGEIMSACVTRPVSQVCNAPSYPGQAARCGMGGGCSGGPWLINLNAATGIGVQISVNSFTCAGVEPYMMHGPYFGSLFQTVYNSIKSRR